MPSATAVVLAFTAVPSPFVVLPLVAILLQCGPHRACLRSSHSGFGAGGGCRSVSIDDKRCVSALAGREAAGFHPAIGAIEQRDVIVVDMLVAYERLAELMRLQSALGVGRDVMGVFVEVGVDQID